MGLERTGPMKSWPVDAANPGEVLACAGLAHLAWREDPNARTGFRVAGGGEVRFEAPAPPRALALERLGPDRLRLAGVELDWWRAWGLNPALRTWAGRQSAWTVHRALRGAAEGADPRDWPTFSAPSRARLHLDPAGSWDTLRLGFSANEHRAAPVCCRPLVELLASLGLGAFPLRRSGDRFSYRLWTQAALPGALAAFSGNGRFVHALGAFDVRTGRTGRNRTLGRASPLQALVPRLRPGSKGGHA